MTARVDSGQSGRQTRGARDQSRAPLWSLAAAAGLLALGYRGDRPAPPRVARPLPAPPRPGLLRRLWHEIDRDRVIALAGGIAFFAILALFPGIAALVSLYGLFADPATMTDHLATLADFVPAGGLEVIAEQMARVSAQGSSTLGLAFLVSFAISLWSANAGTKSLFDALNIVYGEVECRGFVKLTAISLLFTFAALLFLLVSIAALIALPIALGFIGLSSEVETLVSIARWPVLLLGVMLALAMLYHYGPYHPNPRRYAWFSWGTFLASFGWIGLSMLFSWYAASVADYNETYGSLGAVIGFMTWIWLSAIVILLGAEIDSELAKDRALAPPPPHPLDKHPAEPGRAVEGRGAT